MTLKYIMGRGCCSCGSEWEGYPGPERDIYSDEVTDRGGYVLGNHYIREYQCDNCKCLVEWVDE